MRRRVSLFALLSLSLVCLAKEVEIELQDCTYEQLGELVYRSKGKTVLVDFWGDFCLPCKKKFPDLVELHRKYQPKGLRCFSVSLDDHQDPEARPRALAFLKQQKAAFTNLILTEHPKVWQDKLQTVGPPCLFLFDDEGRLVQKWVGNEIARDKVEKRVRELLNLK
jgi:thiol-disulfide isomerase/thioredoxin